MNRTFIHFQAGLPGWARSWFERTRAGWGKLMDPGESPPLPECPWVQWVIRKYDQDNIAAAEVLAGEQGAWAHYQRIRPWLVARPYLRWPNFYFEHHNEPSNFGALSTSENRRALSAYGARFTRLLWENEGIRSVAGCLGVGHPEPYHAVEACAAPMAAVLACEGLYSFHEYGWPAMNTGSGWWTLRYRKTLQALRDAGYNQFPPIVITETGLDRLLTGIVGGWQSLNNDPRWYADQLAWYDGELGKDGIQGAFVFTGTPNHPWESYEVTEGLASEVAKRWSGEPEPPGPEPPGPEPGGPMKIYDKAGNEKDWTWLQAEFGPVEVAGAPAGAAWRVTELREADGYAAILVRATPGKRVARWWPDSSLPPLPTPLSTWKAKGVWAEVKPEGHCDFGMGGGDHYFPPGVGASWYWMEGESDCCQGWGMLADNHRHIDITFSWVEDGQPPEPPVTDWAIGVDVSQYQGVLDWDAVQAAGASFAFIRASAGLVADSQFGRNWEEAGKRGILRGAYHYLRQQDAGQARLFLDSIGDRFLELGCWGDLEQAGLTAAKCEQFLQAFDSLSTHQTGIYTRASFFNAYGSPAWAAGRKLWVASPGTSSPTLPQAWSDWEFWQHGQGTIASQTVDLDRYNGTVEDLHAEYGEVEPPEPPEPPDDDYEAAIKRIEEAETKIAEAQAYQDQAKAAIAEAETLQIEALGLLDEALELLGST